MNLLALLFTVGYLQQNSPMCHWADDFFSLLFCSGIFVNNLPVLLQAYESDFTSVCFRNASEWSLKRCPFMATRSVTVTAVSFLSLVRSVVTFLTRIYVVFSTLVTVEITKCARSRLHLGKYFSLRRFSRFAKLVTEQQLDLRNVNIRKSLKTPFSSCFSHFRSCFVYLRLLGFSGDLQFDLKVKRKKK